MNRLRRARCLVCSYASDGLVAHPYPDAEPVALRAGAAEVLAAFGEWATPKEAAAALSAHGHDPDAVERIIDELAARHVLLREDSERARLDAELAELWGPWGPQAPFLHYTTQDFTPPVLPSPDDQPPPAPPLFTTYPDAPRVALPPPQPTALGAAFGTVLHARRTHYGFADTPVTPATLATLLATVFGPVEYLDAGPFGTLYRRTTPCAGARQELEGYLAIRNVEDIAPGWYHYNARDHALELLADGCPGDELTALCAGQPHVAGAAFVVVLVAAVERQLAHHATPRAYRVCLLDAGHLGQTFVLTATALGLGPFQLSACDDAAIATRLGLDNATHTPLHLLGAGHPSDPPLYPTGTATAPTA
ncbi:SagB/ThcOx family dehydrogenase [Streptomyces sp. 6N223]|uniref:SagB/ThcOx family dehydrogenase n=1 Tax=Streptomyces sp. 6N223 TaxID=3457412 RepID=UPI003FD28B5D